MSQAGVEVIDLTVTDKNELDHWVCETCHPNADTAYCSTNVSMMAETQFEQASCVVCEDLTECPECGQ